jgi:hypothetical protein
LVYQWQKEGRSPIGAHARSATVKVMPSEKLLTEKVNQQ